MLVFFSLVFGMIEKKNRRKEKGRLFLSGPGNTEACLSVQRDKRVHLKTPTNI